MESGFSNIFACNNIPSEYNNVDGNKIIFQVLAKTAAVFIQRRLYVDMYLQVVDSSTVDVI